jgi:hypothetical protein
MSEELAHDDVACNVCGRVGFHADDCWKRSFIAYIPNKHVLGLSKDKSSLETLYANKEGVVIEERDPFGNYPYYHTEFYYPSLRED